MLDGYKENRQEFLLKAMNKPDYLEELTGITAMLSSVKIDEIENFEFDDDML